MGSYSEDSALEPIAICGMSCQLPGGVDSPSSFWKMLVEKRTAQTPVVPKSRFDIDAYYHKENLARPGSFDMRGGYFLDGRPEDFDPSFFKITPIEAQWMDPQQRRTLEETFRCLESAGVTWDAIAGSNTAVFVGCFTSDYLQMSIHEPDFRHNYVATGVDPGLISNRISNIFDLKGPSCTINTACSSSIYAIHNACNALRSRDCSAAIAAGVNLIFSVDQHMNTAKLDIFSPTSTCHTFDASADGYGRAEAAGALYLKRLSDAIKDGDPIRGVIRSTAVNTNGKVEGMGITHPSTEGQERVVRTAYDKARLDPNLTAYAEMHGTGTPVGDPIEAKSIAKALNDTRPKDRPLIVGGVKPNIGHSEAASGISAVMKAALMTEHATIPGVALLKRLNPEILDKEWNIQVQRETGPWPDTSPIRRASVSSFGYGGTNGHVIVESIDSLYPSYSHAIARHRTDRDDLSSRPMLFCLSAHNQWSLKANVEALAEVASKYRSVDLAYTLNEHRTRFSQRGFIVSSEANFSAQFGTNTMKTGAAPKSTPSIGYIFTGQGAQWANMGRGLLRTFPHARDTAARIDRVLEKLSDNPSFKVADTLLGLDEETQGRVGEPDVSQLLCTAIQIILVDLFASWNIVPQVSIGHSSGEIAAAYAAGLISASEAIVIAHCRGRAVAEHSVPGSMLAVGMGVTEIQEHIALVPETICVACDNSPDSVTLSGESKAISELQAKLTSAGIFAREVRTGRAYHSPHMTCTSRVYEKMLKSALACLTANDLQWTRDRSAMISTVTGEPYLEQTLPDEYWSTNLRQRVNFNSAVSYVGRETTKFGKVTQIIEIGPHSALGGPFKQICRHNNLDRFSYVPTLVRKKDDAEQVLSTAGSLFVSGYPVDLAQVNSLEATNPRQRPTSRHLLIDLPPYKWNYEKRYWAESRVSVEKRSRAFPRHDVLGTRVSGLSARYKVWRNVLRHKDLPWLKEHKLDGLPVFPAAGYLSAAIEALTQINETEGTPSYGFTMRDVAIKKALALDEDDDEGVEVIVCLENAEDPGWHTFTFESLKGKIWTLHCKGLISTNPNGLKEHNNESPVVKSALSQKAFGKTWYKAFRRVGFHYGKAFQQLHHVQTEAGVGHAAGDLQVTKRCAEVQGESRYCIHPATIDACLQLIIVSIHQGRHKSMPWAVVPIHFGTVSIFAPASSDSENKGQATAWTDASSGRYFNTNSTLVGESGQSLLTVKDLRWTAYEAALPQEGLEMAPPTPFSTSIWKPDISRMTSRQLNQLYPSRPSVASRIETVISLISHRQPIKSAVCISVLGEINILQAGIEALPQDCTLTICIKTSTEEDDALLSDIFNARPTGKTLIVNPEDPLSGPFDIVLNIDKPFVASADNALINDGGWIVGRSGDKEPPLANSAADLEVVLFLQKNEIDSSPPLAYHHSTGILWLATDIAKEKHTAIASALLQGGASVQALDLANFSHEVQGRVVVIDDRLGNILHSMDELSYQSLKAVVESARSVLWLTQGVREGRCPAGAMVDGFVRVIRSEYPSTNIITLDMDSTGYDANTVAGFVLGILGSVASRTANVPQDNEFWFHQGCLHISRLYPDKELNSMWDKRVSQADLLSQTVPYQKPLTATVVDGLVALKHDEPDESLGGDEVEIQNETSEVGFHQRFICFSGLVVRQGASITRDLVGKRAVAIIRGGFRTIVRTSRFFILETDIDLFAQAPLVSSLRPLVTLAGTSKLSGVEFGPSDHILCLPAPKPVTSMLKRLSKSRGFILETWGQDMKRDDSSTIFRDYETENADINLVVIAFDFSRLSKEVWRHMPANSRFVLVTDPSPASEPVVPDVLPFARGASFTTISLSKHLASATFSQDVLYKAISWTRDIADLPAVTKDFSSVTKFGEVANEKDWERDSEHVRIVSNIYDSSPVKVLPATQSHLFDPNSTYLLVGCLGGLGRSLTRWMMSRGARHFAFVSRTGAKRPQAKRVIDAIMTNASNTATVLCENVADQDAMERIIRALEQERPIRGVVHAAMVLNDCFFTTQTHRSFVDTIAPKVSGAPVLQKALHLAGSNPDFFLLTSSISALLGNPGQSSYSAANSFLDGLAMSEKLPKATSLVLPMILDVGIVAEDEGGKIEASLEQKGLYGIDEEEMLKGVEMSIVTAMNATRSAANHSRCNGYSKHEYTNGDVARVASHNDDGTREAKLVMGIDASNLAKAIQSAGGHSQPNIFWYDDARFCHVRAQIEAAVRSGDSPDARSNGVDDLVHVLQTAFAIDMKAGLDLIANQIAKQLSNTLMVPVESIDIHGETSVASYGLDSMVGAEIRTWLFREYGLDFAFQKLLAPTLTFRALASSVAEVLGFLPTEKVQ